MYLKNDEIEIVEKKLSKVYKKILQIYSTADLLNWVDDSHLLKLTCVQDFLLKEDYSLEDIKMYVEDKTSNLYKKNDLRIEEPDLTVDYLLAAESIDDMINRIFYGTYRVKYFNVDKSRNNKINLGYHIELPDLSKKTFDELHSFYKLHYNANKKIKKFVLGNNNKLDYESSQQEVRMYLYKTLVEVFSGSKNDKLEESLQINSLEDIKLIIKSKNRSKKLCNYILQVVEWNIRHYAERSDNPDFYYNKTSKRYTAKYYNYLDNINYEETNERGRKQINETWKELDEKVKIQKEQNKTGELAEFIICKYLTEEILSPAEYRFVKLFLDNQLIGGALVDKQNNVVMEQSHVSHNKKRVLKRIAKLIEEDEILDINEKGRMYLNWEGK